MTLITAGLSHLLLSMEYYVLNEIMDKTTWARFIYKTTTLAEGENNVGICSSKCKQESNPASCDMFAIVVSHSLFTSFSVTKITYWF